MATIQLVINLRSTVLEGEERTMLKLVDERAESLVIPTRAFVTAHVALTHVDTPVGHDAPRNSTIGSYITVELRGDYEAAREIADQVAEWSLQYLPLPWQATAVILDDANTADEHELQVITWTPPAIPGNSITRSYGPRIQLPAPHSITLEV
jgi:hypothetical protein